MRLLSGRLGILAVILATVSASLPAFANDVVVDCSGATPGAFTTVNAALLSLPKIGPNSIAVSGTCSETVLVVGFSDLTIFANPSATIAPPTPNGRGLVVFETHNLSIAGPIVFSGGRGLFINQNTTASLDSIAVQNSGGIGITSIDSLVHLSNSSVTNSTRSGISVGGGTFYVDGGVTVSNNGRSGISAGTAHLILNGGDGVTPGTENVISHNTGVGVAVFNTSEGDINADNRITNNGSFGLEIIHTSTVLMSDGSINSNTGVGVHCGESSHCEWSGVTQIDSNGAGGIEVTDHSDAYLDGGIDVSGNTGVGVLVDLSSLLNSLGGNTIKNNTDDGIVVNNLSVLKFAANDTITGNTNLALECDNGSMVVGDVSTYKPKKCGPAFQSKPIH